MSKKKYKGYLAEAYINSFLNFNFDQRSVEVVLSELKVLISKEVHKFRTHEIQNMLEKVKFSSKTKALLLALCIHKMLSFLPELYLNLKNSFLKKINCMEVVLTLPFEENDKGFDDQIISFFESKFGKKVYLVKKVDECIIDGFKINFNFYEIDNTVYGKFKTLKKLL